MKVLVVEDNRLARKVLVTYLEKLEYEVVQAQSGDEGYVLWCAQHPEIVLTDWNMPGSNGIELIEKIRQHKDEYYSYIILITSREEEDDLTVGFEAGADDYIIKPVNHQELVLRMRAGERLLSMQTKDQLLFAMAKLAEARDHDTGQHLERIRLYSCLLSIALSQDPCYKPYIDEKFINNIYETSPLHDIGKVGIPDAILLKRGKLTTAEYAVIKTHTVIGRRTLQEVARLGGYSDLLTMAIQIAGCHHERWDGSGYPDGIQGEAIPLCARIVALVDVYDALRSKRIYKDGWNHDVVVKEILESEGTYFDPCIIKVFSAIADKFEEISKKLSD